MDAKRYQDLLARDRQMEAKIKELESKGVQRDPTYTPPGTDPDLMYTDEYAEAVYNPQVQPAPAADPSAPRSRWPGFLRVVLVLGLVAFVIWFVFIKRWGGTSGA
jgi:hypothetical protein